MTSVWAVKECRSSSLRLLEDLADGSMVCHSDLVNVQEIYAAGYCGGRERTIPFPIAKLKLTLEDFDADCFRCDGHLLVSERMRQVMRLDPRDVRFFDVDASLSAPAPRSKNYQIIEPAVTEDVSDPDKSDYGVLPLDPDTHMKAIMDGVFGDPVKPEHRAGFEEAYRLLSDRSRDPLDTRRTLIEAESIAMRRDVVPTHELFYDRFFHNHLFCTESFAMRILQAGCTGIRFIDPSRLGFGMKRRYRTLRGIEEHVKWDFDNKVEITRLIQPID